MLIREMHEENSANEAAEYATAFVSERCLPLMKLGANYRAGSEKRNGS